MKRQLLFYLIIFSFFFFSSCSTGLKRIKVQLIDPTELAEEAGADTKVSDLPELATTPADSDEFYINDGGVSKKIQYSNLGIGSGDVTGVGDCTSGDCYDGTSDGGTYARFYDGDSHYFQWGPENIAANYILSPPTTIGTSGQLWQSDGDNTTSWTSSLNLAFRDTVPEVLLRDTDAIGAADADEDAGSIKANMSTTTEDAEVSDMFFTAFGVATAGTEYTHSWFDSSDAAYYIGVMTDSTTPADVAGYEKLKIDCNTSTDKEITMDGEDDAYLNIKHLKHETWSFDPDAVCDGDVDRLFLFTSDGTSTFIKWTVSFEADPTTEADLDLKYADAFIGVANSAVMDVLDTTNGTSSESTPGNINSGTAVADTKVVYLEFGTAYTETGHQIIVEVWYY